MDYSVALGIVLMSNCDKDICCCDREDSETSFEDKHSNAVSIYVYIELTPAKNISSV